VIDNLKAEEFVDRTSANVYFVSSAPILATSNHIEVTLALDALDSYEFPGIGPRLDHLAQVSESNAGQRLKRVLQSAVPGDEHQPATSSTRPITWFSVTASFSR